MGIVVGCDIGKAWIDVEGIEPAGNKRMRIANERRAIDRFVRDLPAGSSVGMEATGQLHERLADTLFEHGHTVFVINPRWVRHYGKSLGLRGKTDRGDAALIARFVASEAAQLHPYEPPSAAHKELRRMLLQRRKLVELKTATRQSLGDEARALIAQFNLVIKGLERRIASLIKRTPEWQQIGRRMASQPGVGPIVSAHLVEVLTRVPFANADAFVAHTGLDPRSNDSGKKHGRRFLTHHGDAALRSMLFMAAMAASQRGSMAAVYQASRQRGLASTAAFVVVARKLARIAFSLYKSGETYDPSRVGAPLNACQAT